MSPKSPFAVAAAAAAFLSMSSTAAVIAQWSVVAPIPSGSVGSNFAVGAADAGEQTAGTGLRGYHALATTVWSTPAGNGSTYAFSSNGWSVGDYYEVSVPTSGFNGGNGGSAGWLGTDISLSWDQTRSSTGPSNFRVDMSTDGTNFTTLLASYTVIQAGASGSNTLSWSTTAGVQSAFTRTISSIAGADNQSTLVFRFVNLSTVAAAGTNRIDNIVVSGTLVPAPGAVALLAVAGLVSRRRR
ncbi:MAG: hypothetical protein FJ285_04360 [Planctomycetes bacterium]|nr:hypothetical protein [Planctomycetota bacterium]